MHLGEFIRSTRKSKNMTATKLAHNVGVSVTTISRVERGEIKPPKDETMHNIARVLGVNADLLFSKSNKPPQELTELYCKNPHLAHFLRIVNQLNQEDFDDLMAIAIKKLANPSSKHSQYGSYG